jgi:hypothetical protein
MRLTCILMDSFEYPTFFKKPCSRARPSFSLPWQIQHDSQCAPHMVCTFAPSSNTSQTQVVPTVDGPEKVSKTTKQASSWVPLLLPTLSRERTFQNMIGIHFCFWCIVVLWPGRRHFYVLTVFFGVLFSRGFAFFEGKKK